MISKHTSLKCNSATEYLKWKVECVNLYGGKVKDTGVFNGTYFTFCPKMKTSYFFSSKACEKESYRRIFPSSIARY